ncbi:MAG TPA: hypothetical protein VEP50_07150 [bacterium]|nr:hypothetical protein [bacterium]
MECRRGRFRLGGTFVVVGYHHGGARSLIVAAKDRGSVRAVTLLGRLLAGFLLGAPCAATT